VSVPDPLTTSLLVALAQEMARVGIPKLLAMIGKQPAALGAHGPYTTRLRVAFQAPIGPRPHWMLFAMQRADGVRAVEVPVLFGEPLVIDVPRQQYEIVTLFLSKPLSFADKPLLTAVARAHEVVASGYQQRITLEGRQLSAAEIELMRSQDPEAKTFRLPTTRQQRVTALSRLTPSSGLLAGLGAPARPALPPGTARRPVRRSAPDRELLLRRGTGTSPELAKVLRNLPTTPTARPAAPAPATCRARSKTGARCTNPPEPGKGGVCALHLKKIYQRKDVRDHASGKRILPLCEASGDEGKRCSGGAVRDRLCDRHLTLVAGHRPVHWHLDGQAVQLSCGARTRAGNRCRNDHVSGGLCGTHLSMALSGDAVWDDTSEAIRLGKR
jgi:hypothetical protein